jgi:hypothetical protein
MQPLAVLVMAALCPPATSRVGLAGTEGTLGTHVSRNRHVFGNPLTQHMLRYGFGSLLCPLFESQQGSGASISLLVPRCLRKT